MKSNSVCVHFFIFFLFFAKFGSSEPTLKLAPHYDIPELQVKLFEIKSTLVLMCNATIEEDSEDLELIWLKDGQEINKVSSLDGRTKKTEDKGVYKLSITRAMAEDAGNYTCMLQEEGVSKVAEHLVVASKPAVKLVPNTSVVEGEKLTIHCQVLGKPTPIVSWEVGNETYETSRDRVQLLDDKEAGVPNAILVIEETKLSDRNEYSCMARTNYTTEIDHKSVTYVRVKDKLAALWPFLGICAEVFVLCAIILIYEKKRNKTELEESDTDQSPDHMLIKRNIKD